MRRAPEPGPKPADAHKLPCIPPAPMRPCAPPSTSSFLLHSETLLRTIRILIVIKSHLFQFPESGQGRYAIGVRRGGKQSGYDPGRTPRAMAGLMLKLIALSFSALRDSALRLVGSALALALAGCAGLPPRAPEPPTL